jgi:hypothetical protein
MERMQGRKRTGILGAGKPIKEKRQMAWFSRFTRFGDMHWVFGQEHSISCGVACVIMAAYKINKLWPGVKSTFTEKDILQMAAALFGQNPLGNSGLNGGQMIQLLNHSSLRMGGWSFSSLPPGDVPAQIVRKVGTIGFLGPTVFAKPIIALVNWSGGGGHWVLIDSVREFFGQKYATVCDPWDANVHVVPMKLNASFNYTGKQTFAVDFGGTHYAYGSPAAGSVFLGVTLAR